VGAAVAVAVSAYQPLVAINYAGDAYASSVSKDELAQIVASESMSAEEQAAAQEAAALREALGGSSEAFDMPATLKDGTYTGTSYGYKSYITVQVVVSDGKIASVSIVSEDDDAAYMTRARALLSTIVSAQSPNVDVVSGATYSSNGIINAVKQALAKAAGTTYVASETAEGGNSATASASDEILGSLSKPIDFGSADDSLPSGVEVSVDGPYADGTYVASAYCENVADPDAWTPYYLTVEVEVAGGQPTIVDVYGAATADDQSDVLDAYDTDNDMYLDNAAYGTRKKTGVIDQYAQADAAFSDVQIDAVSGATYSSYAIREAYGKALYAAAKAHALVGTADSGNAGDSNIAGDAQNPSQGDSSTDASEQKNTFQQLIDSIWSHIKNLGKVS
jgi:uncharacterized protein with FMN-binding domain